MAAMAGLKVYRIRYNIWIWFFVISIDIQNTSSRLIPCSRGNNIAHEACSIARVAQHVAEYAIGIAHGASGIARGTIGVALEVHIVMHSDHGTPRPARIVYPIQKNTRGTILSVKTIRMLCLQYRPRNDSHHLSVPKGHQYRRCFKENAFYTVISSGPEY